MSLLAGFDMSVLIRGTAIVRLLTTPPFGFNRPPFDLNLASDVEGIVDSINCEVGARLNAVDITLTFGRILVRTAAKPICNQSGSITMSFDLSLAPGPAGTNVVSLATTLPVINFHFSQASNQVLTQAGVNVADLEQRCSAAAAALPALAGVGLGLSLLSFHVQPGVDGSIDGGGLVFEDLQLRCVARDAYNGGCIGLFGTLFAANHGKGKLDDAKVSAASDGELVVSCAPDVVRCFLVCPVVAEALNGAFSPPVALTAAELPLCCSPGKPIKVPNAPIPSDVTRIDVALNDGAIRITTHVRAGVFCGTIHVRVPLDLKLSIEYGLLRVDIEQRPLEKDFEYDFWCAVGAALTGGVGIAAAVPAFYEIALGYTSFDAVTSNVTFPKTLPLPFNLQPLNVLMKEVRVDSQSLVFSGEFVLPEPEVTDERFGIRMSRFTVRKTESANGVIHRDTGCMKGNYPYQEFEVDEELELSCAINLLHVVSIAWSLTVGGREVQLAAGTGKEMFPNVDREFHTAEATVTIPGDVEVQYTLDPLRNLLVLRNAGKDGNYWVHVKAVALCCTKPNTGLFPVPDIRVATFQNTFLGHTLEIDPQYQRQMFQCMRDILRKIHNEPIFAPGVPVNPLDFAKASRLALASGNVELLEYLGQSKALLSTASLRDRGR